MGNRLAVAEHEGAGRSYEYDALYRLTRERVETAEPAFLYQNEFTYDAVGNRLQQTRLAADGSVETVTYTYDQRDRLLAEASTQRALSYQWDVDGLRPTASRRIHCSPQENRPAAWGVHDRHRLRFPRNAGVQEDRRVATERPGKKRRRERVETAEPVLLYQQDDLRLHIDWRCDGLPPRMLPEDASLSCDLLAESRHTSLFLIHRREAELYEHTWGQCHLDRLGHCE